RGRDLHDSALVLAAQWPVAAQLKWERYHDQLISARGKLTPAQADSAFEAGTVRLFQHILIRIPHSAVPVVEQRKQKQVAARKRPRRHEARRDAGEVDDWLRPRCMGGGGGAVVAVRDVGPGAERALPGEEHPRALSGALGAGAGYAKPPRDVQGLRRPAQAVDE